MTSPFLDLPSGLGAADTVVHVGPGTLEGRRAYPATAARVLLIEPDPELGAGLEAQIAGQDNVTLIASALLPVQIRPVLVRYSLPEFNGFRAPTGLKRLYPGLKRLSDLAVPALSVAQLLGRLGPTAGADVLGIEAAGEERAILDALAEAGALDRFARVVLTCGRAPLFEGAGSAAELAAWLTGQGFDRPQIVSGADPELVTLIAGRNPLRAALAKAEEAAQARIAELTAELAACRAEAEARTQRLVLEAETLRETLSRTMDETAALRAQLGTAEAEAAETAAREAALRTESDALQDEMIRAAAASDRRLADLRQRLTLGQAEMARIESQFELLKDLLLRAETL